MAPSAQSLYWIEPATITSLLEVLDGRSGATPTAAGARASASPASKPVVPAAAVGCSVTEPMAVAETALVDRPADDAMPSLTLPRRPFEARLAALLDWLVGVVVYQAAFVIDHEGLTLAEDTAATEEDAAADEQASAEIVAAAAALGRTLTDLSQSGELAETTCLTLELPSRHRLYLFVATTPWGELQLGFMTQRLLPRDTLEGVAEAFHRTVDDKEHDR
ncbi:MAG: hypothetical protein AAF657_05540 [Acidobacteriota bacterium]